MNLKTGGEGGWNLSKEQYKDRNTKCSRRLGEKLKSDPEFREKFRQKIRDNCKNTFTGGKTKGTTGHKFSDEYKEKKSESMKGERNPSFGTCWIYSDSKSIRIKLSDLDSYLSEGWKRGRRINSDLA